MVLVTVISNRVGVANQVQPIHRHSFAKVRGAQQLVNHAFIFFLRTIVNKTLDFLRVRRQSDQVKIQTANQRDSVGAAKA